MSDKGKIIEIMKRVKWGASFATCDGEKPDVRIVSPFIEDDLNIQIATFTDSNKVKQIKNNPRIALLFIDDDYNQVIVYGEAVIVENKNEKRILWEKRKASLSRYFPEGYESPDFCLLRIDIDYIKWEEADTFETKTYTPE
jgi:general stress protein 26